MINLELMLDHTVQLGHDDAALQCRLLGEQLVVHQLVVAARIVGTYVGDIAPVHPQDTESAQCGRGYQPDHFMLAMSRKRYSSDRRYPVYLPINRMTPSRLTSSSGKLKVRCSTTRIDMTR